MKHTNRNRPARTIAVVVATCAALLGFAVPAHAGVDGAPDMPTPLPDPTPFAGGLFVASGDVDGDGFDDVIVGLDAGGLPGVKVFSGLTHQQIYGFLAYDATFRGGVRVAAGDVNGDGHADIITAPGPRGGPHVKVFSGANLQVLKSYLAFDSTVRTGLFVAAGDVDASGTVDIITSLDQGGTPEVRVNDSRDLHPIADFLAFAPDFRGGVRVAAGDLTGDGHADLVVGAGPGGGPHVRAINGADLHDLHSFFAYSPLFPGGVYVAAGDVNGDGKADLLTGAGAGGGPHVRLFDGTNLTDLSSFYAYDPRFPGGARVAIGDVDGEQQSGRNLVFGAGPSGGPHVRVTDRNGRDLLSFFA